ncbi:hypothetical protein L553_1015 [Bordetella pertussis I036]|uniref:Uncharacterized protein n=1 Tax=Bordetella bronchiseptica 00-P-2796 TaxID=1331199 RepID=A0ABR4RAZ3_BORBO|nr:hypothetical protein L553_1015 [Bordetella pertussis I036]ETH82225.1 hypothetical protein L559_3408 [Bordetella pertussis STO1-CHOC-0017]ETH87837.1 hypothetical protein L560_3478 [Bordetella pertussis STO1-CHOC-0018]ETH90591.1 hypothetical protein L561_3436 [Bordetella pertussis STO1-CHOC-0019]KAK72047.1 hypothetical protein L507_4129 [Bordetella bronchiseptica CA90 BB02]KCV32830.1 hypothetical protein L490_4022 [Bordetella bronchiseptica 00-P-2796]KCV56576.1 hypothetical protein L492_4231
MGQGRGCNFFNHNKDLEPIVKTARGKLADKSAACADY